MPTALMTTDLDGTLLDAQSQLSTGNRQALDALAERQVVRAIATGRSLHSARRVLDAAFPIDYLAFSSGAGIVHWPSGELLVQHDMPVDTALAAASALQRLGIDFMLHKGVPANHHFYYWRNDAGGRQNADFETRLARYARYAQPWRGQISPTERISQLVAIEPQPEPGMRDELTAKLQEVSIILATSPLDHSSRWLEIFPAGVNKAQAGEWLRRRYNIAQQHTFAIGNDYNDIDLLDWASTTRVVANAPDDMRERYRVVASHEEDGFCAAIENWCAAGFVDR